MSSKKRELNRNEKIVIRIMAATAIVAAIIFAVILYVNDYYKPTEKAQKAMLGNDNVSVTETEEYYLFDIKEEATKGIVFYPGGKVDEKAYAPMLLELAENGYEVYLVKMPAKLAIFGMNAAEDIITAAPHIEDWTMMGHSLGGAMAASFCAEYDEEIDELVLLAAYSMEDLSDKDIKVYSFYGSEDKVLNMENYDKYYENLPDDMIEEVIEGGNHAGYAHYGEQEGDGKAAISREEQQESVLDILLSTQ